MNGGTLERSMRIGAGRGLKVPLWTRIRRLGLRLIHHGPGLLAGMVLTWRLAAAGMAVVEPGPPVDYRELAFEPERWKARQLDARLVPWRGKEVVFLTTPGNRDGAVMARFLERLDGGWALYRELTGCSPNPLKQLGGLPTIAAVPGADLTCGYGCGFIGATGIEIGGFYDSDYPRVKARPRVFPHYYFYEIGRNYYTFGDRHSSFITGFAVFMRYVCMDTLGCEDDDRAARETIEKAESLFARSDMGFLAGFTLQGGLDEKAPRLEGVEPSDQPVIYASAMLRLHRECGGNAWLKRFFAGLSACPEVKADSPDGALRQSYHWLVAASAARRQDLCGIFVDQWRLPLAPATRQALGHVAWKDGTASVSAVLRGVKPEFTR